MRALSLLSLLSVLAPAHASAHMGSTAYLFVAPTSDGARVVAELDRVDVGYELDLDDPEQPEDAALVARSADVQRWLEQSITMRTAGGACHGVASPLELDTRAAGGGPIVRVALTYACPAPRTDLTLEDRAVFDADPQHESLVRIEGHEGAAATVLRRGRQTAPIDDLPSTTAVARTFLVEGVLHLVTGYDHVLFLVSLLLVAGEVVARQGRRRALRDVAVVVTGFTLGHSVTLIAAALDVVTLPTRIVESAIALSIAVVAVWNIARPEARAALPGVAFVFGLIHGFGFSSVLRDLVLPTNGRLVALLSFNVGIELAQLAIVLAVLGPLGWAARSPRYRPIVVRGGSTVITVVALFWFVQRACA